MKGENMDIQEIIREVDDSLRRALLEKIQYEEVLNMDPTIVG